MGLLLDRNINSSTSSQDNKEVEYEEDEGEEVEEEEKTSSFKSYSSRYPDDPIEGTESSSDMTSSLKITGRSNENFSGLRENQEYRLNKEEIDKEECKKRDSKKEDYEGNEKESLIESSEEEEEEEREEQSKDGSENKFKLTSCFLETKDLVKQINKDLKETNNQTKNTLLKITEKEGVNMYLQISKNKPRIVIDFVIKNVRKNYSIPIKVLQKPPLQLTNIKYTDNPVLFILEWKQYFFGLLKEAREMVEQKQADKIKEEFNNILLQDAQLEKFLNNKNVSVSNMQNNPLQQRLTKLDENITKLNTKLLKTKQNNRKHNDIEHMKCRCIQIKDDNEWCNIFLALDEDEIESLRKNRNNSNVLWQKNRKCIYARTVDKLHECIDTTKYDDNPVLFILECERYFLKLNQHKGLLELFLQEPFWDGFDSSINARISKIETKIKYEREPEDKHSMQTPKHTISIEEDVEENYASCCSIPTPKHIISIEEDSEENKKTEEDKKSETSSESSSSASLSSNSINYARSRIQGVEKKSINRIQAKNIKIGEISTYKNFSKNDKQIEYKKRRVLKNIGPIPGKEGGKYHKTNTAFNTKIDKLEKVSGFYPEPDIRKEVANYQFRNFKGETTLNTRIDRPTGRKWQWGVWTNF